MSMRVSANRGKASLRCIVCKLAIGAAALSLLTIVAGVQQAQAHQRDFPFTYDWRQPAKGEKEIELHSRYRERDRSFEQQIEFEYGVTDRFAIAPYIVFEKEAGEDLEYAEWKLEARYQIGDYKLNTVLPGLYLEYEQPKEGKGAIEAKLILSVFDNRGGDLSFNYIVERELESGAEWEHEYSLGYMTDLGRDTTRRLRGGVEWIHNLESNRINAGPVFGFAPSNNTWIVTHYVFPVNNEGGNKGEFRLLAEIEWF